MFELENARNSIGRSEPRINGPSKVTGAATYAAECSMPAITYGAVVDSAIACGSIREIDLSEALAAPGVITVLPHDNAPRLQAFPSVGGGQQLMGDGSLAEARQPLQDSTIYYAGQSIDVVVADTFERARHAATLVRVAYDKHVPELVMITASRCTIRRARSEMLRNISLRFSTCLNPIFELHRTTSAARSVRSVGHSSIRCQWRSPRASSIAP